jgi:hypothetical protein
VFVDLGLKVSDFTEPRNRALFSAMVQMKTANEVSMDHLCAQREKKVNEIA